MNNRPSIHIFISGFGSPHLEEKLRILKNNMDIINRYNWGKIKYTICCYDDSDLTKYEAFENVSVVREKLIVGQFIQKYLIPDTPSTEFDYLLCILDDIEFQPNINFEQIIHYTNFFDIDILSPSMTLDSKFQFKYMLHCPEHKKNLIKITVALEYFCYFMRPSSYKKYYPHVNGEKNPWMWGLDMLLKKHVDLKLGVINHMTMKHWYKSENYTVRPDADPFDGYAYIMKKYNETMDTLANQQSELFFIFEV